MTEKFKVYKKIKKNAKEKKSKSLRTSIQKFVVLLLAYTKYGTLTTVSRNLTLIVTDDR